MDLGDSKGIDIIFFLGRLDVSKRLLQSRGIDNRLCFLRIRLTGDREKDPERENPLPAKGGIDMPLKTSEQETGVKQRGVRDIARWVIIAVFGGIGDPCGGYGGCKKILRGLGSTHSVRIVQQHS